VKELDLTFCPSREFEGIARLKIYLPTSKLVGNFEKLFFCATRAFFCVCAERKFQTLLAGSLVDRYKFEREDISATRDEGYPFPTQDPAPPLF